MDTDWLERAHQCRQRSDSHGEEAAINALLEQDPRSLRGIIAKADCRQRAGDEIMATYLLRRAIRLSQSQRMTPELAGDIGRAKATLNGLLGRQGHEFEMRLAQRGVPASTRSPRFKQSLEIAAGRKELYQQEPTAFAYPGLPNIQFYEREQFDWVAGVEAATSDIRAELLALLDDASEDFRPYVRAHISANPIEDNAQLADSKDWSVLDLCENGWALQRVLERCPRTWNAVLSAPVPRIAGWGPTVVFSLLKGGARIAPHTGMFNTRLICHLPLIVPPGCGFRVGNEVRQWEVGKLLIFDDTIEHEAWNDSDEDRVVLIFDVWRPELSEQERRELTALFSD